MTLNEFFAVLEKTQWNFAWRYATKRSSRYSSGYQRRICADITEDNQVLEICPLEAVYWEVTGLHRDVRDYTVRDRLNLGERFQEIIAAADERVGFDPELRARLLEACGLPAESAI